MADKTWTATDLELGKLTINRNRVVSSTLRIERRYKFLDADGEVLEQIAGRSVLLDVEIADIPSDILTALQAIDTWTKNRALEQEGMADV